jgi:hypothetical protein
METVGQGSRFGVRCVAPERSEAELLPVIATRDHLFPAPDSIPVEIGEPALT